MYKTNAAQQAFVIVNHLAPVTMLSGRELKMACEPGQWATERSKASPTHATRHLQSPGVQVAGTRTTIQFKVKIFQFDPKLSTD